MQVELVDGESRRLVAAQAFPLAIGGPEADIRPQGVAAEQPLAFLGLDGGELFVQPAAVGAPVLCNGSRLTSSQWLRDGDVLQVGSCEIALLRQGKSLRLVIEQRGADRDTEPPRVARIGRRAESAEEVPVGIEPVEFSLAPHAQRRRRRRLRLVAVLTWLSAAALAAVAWVLLTARSVEIRIEPEPDRLRVEGGLPAVKVAGRYLLRPGSYRVSAEREGYERLEAGVEVSREASQSVLLRMRKLPGRLRVVTVPDSEGVEVRIDGEAVGRTPLGAVELEPGKHAVSLAGERFLAWEGVVEIEGAGSLQEVKVELTPRWAEIGFESVPPGAQVRVDGRLVGSTPIRAEIPEGEHRVEFVLAGYKPTSRRLVVEAGRPQDGFAVDLEPVDGNLVVTSEPPDAVVSVDGEFRGRTPLALELPPGGPHLIGVSKAGFEEGEATVTMESGGSREVHLTLVPRFGELRLSGEPADAEVLVDGESRGPARQTLRLQAVAHEIEVRSPGFEPLRRTVTPRPGFPQSIRFSLRTLDEARRAERKVVIPGPQGQELRLVEPGRFRMGASRREPGRRANETLREVELTRPFYLGAKEVSNRELREFLPQHRSGAVGGISLDDDDRPAVNVTWEEAARFCNWLSRRASLPPAYEERDGRVVALRPLTGGYRLPTEAEWAWAARWGSGARGRKYPWGDALPVAEGSGNFADEAARVVLEATLSGYNDSFAATAPVDAFGPDAAGMFNLGGNVAEWVSDFYTIYPSGAEGVETDPLGPEEGEFRVIRGSSWMHSTITELRLSFRDYSDKSRPDVGFRIARYAD